MNAPFNPNNPLFNMFGGFQQFMSNFNSFAQQITQDPRAIAQQMMNNGQMTQQQFDQCRMMANSLTGKNY